MDRATSKAQKKMKGNSSKSKSKGSARKAKKSKKKEKKEKEPKTQNAGQPSGPSVSTSQRSKSRSAVVPEETASISGGGLEAGRKCASYAVGAMHVIDAGLGLALIIYGGMVHVPSVTATVICYGLVLFLGAVAGTVGYYSEAFNRRGLWASAMAGFLTCFLDIIAFVVILLSWDSFIKLLNDNHEALMLTEDSVKMIQGLKILFAVIFVVLGGLEVHRGLAMWGLKNTMSEQGVTSRSTGGSKCDSLLSMFGLSKKKKTDDFVVFDDSASMESALLWSKNGSQPTSDDYLEFVPEHERQLADFHSNVALPTPPEDQVDY
mmetsp:Transcript_4103/g.10426  ORF Transcript_4103/g.10426 Transcript_4103/m.10426 type:complete len:320 (-) Transcript_4103:101-1060(-)|eukprot:CAMPEP_0181120446 /NCGR_PEP_ID=MMETSP1071-20121207/24163_1 /TAXON_ID=35127 /ORGANISM="Thalassiosira sp., Strain NH16" /LENGTH=319 /DNA_ID=CAMNT_0023205107 /DNA_START=96 /DNA_END=1055 /DNA_ORIENTATION=+